MYPWQPHSYFRKKKKHYNIYGNFKKGRYVSHNGCRPGRKCDANPWARTYLEGKLKQNQQILDSGYTVGQTWTGLQRAWLGYVLSLVEHNRQRMVHYAAIIQKLQRELYEAQLVQRHELADFPHLNMFALGEKRDNARILHEEYTGDLIEEEEEQEESTDDVDYRRWIEKAFNEDGIDRIRL